MVCAAVSPWFFPSMSTVFPAACCWPAGIGRCSCRCIRGRRRHARRPRLYTASTRSCLLPRERKRDAHFRCFTVIFNTAHACALHACIRLHRCPLAHLDSLGFKVSSLCTSFSGLFLTKDCPRIPQIFPCLRALVGVPAGRRIYSIFILIDKRYIIIIF